MKKRLRNKRYKKFHGEKPIEIKTGWSKAWAARGAKNIDKMLG